MQEQENRGNNRQVAHDFANRILDTYIRGFHPIIHPQGHYDRRDFIHCAVTTMLTATGIALATETILFVAEQNQPPPQTLTPEEALKNEQYQSYDMIFNRIAKFIQKTNMGNAFNSAVMLERNNREIIFPSDAVVFPYREARTIRFGSLFYYEAENINNNTSYDRNAVNIMSLLYSYAGSYAKLLPSGSPEYEQDQNTFSIVDTMFQNLETPASTTMADFVKTLSGVYNNISGNDIQPQIEMI